MCPPQAQPKMWSLHSWLAIFLLVISSAGAYTAHPRATEEKPQQERAASSWLKMVSRPKARGCWYQPWVCKEGGGDAKRFPFPKRMCCKNQCIDVSSDVMNCGLCGVRCPFTWQCCNGLCIDTNINPFHCGKCRNKCQMGSLCFYGMCGYAQPLPPFPFPLPPKHPKPQPPPFVLPPKHPMPFPPHFPFPPNPTKPDPNP